MFENRKDAGKQLGDALSRYKGQGVLVLGIPRGGVEVAVEVAKKLDADLEILVSRKLPLPDDPEAGFGAIAEDGSVYLHPWTCGMLDEKTIRKISDTQIREIEKRITILRAGQPLTEIKGRTVIIIDDGIAMGSTVQASIMLCKNKEAGKIVVGSPVSGSDTAHEIARLVDDIVVLEKPISFRSVSQVYMQWYDMSFGEVDEIMVRWHKWQKLHMHVS